MGYGNFIRYCIQFRPYAGKDLILQKYGNQRLGLYASAVVNLVSKLSVIQTSNYQVLECNGSCCNKNGESKPNGKCSIARCGKSKEKRGSSDVVTDVSSNITAVRWKDNKVVNAVSTFTGKQQIQQVKRYYHREKRRVNIEQPNVMNQYNMAMGRVDQRIWLTYAHGNGGGHIFDLLLMWQSIMLTNLPIALKS